MTTKLNRVVCATVGAVAALVMVAAWVMFNGHAIAAEFDLLFQQRNSSDDGTIQRIPLHPATTGPLVFDTDTMQPAWVTLGAGLSVSGGVLDTVAAAPTWATLSGKPAWTSVFDGSYASLTSKPTLFSGAYSDLTGKPSLFDGTWSSLSGKPTFATVATTGAYADLSGKPTIPGAFNFGFPAARTLTIATSYQATDNTKAAVIYPSFACTNATQILASSACTLQVRMHTSAVTCSTGTVYYTQSLAVNLGLLLTQNSTNPMPIFLPAGAFVIFCATAGTFTISTVEQAAS